MFRSALSVSNPGKFHLTLFTNSIQESISCCIPSTTVYIFSPSSFQFFFSLTQGTHPWRLCKGQKRKCPAKLQPSAEKPPRDRVVLQDPVSGVCQSENKVPKLVLWFHDQFAVVNDMERYDFIVLIDPCRFYFFLHILKLFLYNLYNWTLPIAR